MNVKTCTRLNQDIQNNLETIAETQKEIDKLYLYIQKHKNEIDRKSRATQISLSANSEVATCIDEYLVNSVLHKEYILHDCNFVGFISEKHYLSKSGILLWNYDCKKSVPRFCLHIKNSRFLGSLEPHNITKACPDWKLLENLKVGESYGIQN